MRFDPIDKVILFGGSLTLAGLVDWLRNEGLETLIYTSPRHAEEKLDGEKTLSEMLNALEVGFVITEDINADTGLMSEISPSALGIGIGEAWSFDERIIDAFGGKLIDFMGIPLPRYRGGAHYTWMIMSGERENGARLQVINKEMVQGVFDSGEIIASIDYQMEEHERLPLDYFKREVKESIKFLKSFLSDIRKGRDFDLAKINEECSLYFPRLNTLHSGWVDWRSWDGNEIETFIRSFDRPYIGASTRFKGERVFLRNANLLRGEKGFHPFQSGLVTRISDREGVVVATRNGELAIKEIIDEFGNDMILKLTTGIRFFTNAKDLENALQYEAEYAPSGLKSREDVKRFSKVRRLEGEKVTLRSLMVEDCNEVYVSWMNDPEINRYLETRWSVQDLASIKAFVQDIAESDHSTLFGIFRKSDSTHIGNIKIGPVNPQHLYADVSYFIGDRSSWGNGYATESVDLVTRFGFEVMGLKKCMAGSYSGNVSSCRVLEKVGYIQEGCFSNQLKGPDGREDHIMFGLSCNQYL